MGDGGKEDVDKRGTGEERVDEAKQRAEHEPAAIDDGEDRLVAEREQDAEDEVERVSDDLRADPVFGDGGAEQERKVDAREAKLARGAHSRQRATVAVSLASTSSRAG